ncbi:acyl-CoA dehydrogenase family protein [Bacillus solimangrovi]|uniref:Acyl-CoA dehydrogenase n=1 Tax=Bacillus solimangrovi TaxID=1305675 RepID=A0A1E5LH18_9BACI|nr:acyl-CoA dehydrogenase family protein [Bacillus solimangrovi]OEH93373.1 acyl-CoA dehydrogenase [Bacillus solimangrovi]
MPVTMKSHYSFDQFIRVRDSLDYANNPFLIEVLKSFSEEDLDKHADDIYNFSHKVSTKWKRFVESNARVENHPQLRQYDAYNHRIDEIVRPYEMQVIEQEVSNEKLFSKHTSSEIQAVKRFLLHHNGEAGTMCALACTDGLVAILRQFEDELSTELERILLHCTEGIDGEVALGAQFMSEIQGGSNIPANVLEAVQEGNHYQLYGNKFFCSAAHTDYSVVTARVKDTEYVTTFIVPTWKNSDDKAQKRRNGHVVNRLKWKLGTCELPSGEINYEGAIAYPIGPIEKGVANAVAIVLTRSRLDIAFASSAFLMRASREASLYAHFRDVFDRKIDEFPMAKAQLVKLEDAAKRTTATAFHIYKQYTHINQLIEKGEMSQEIQLKHFQIRELILLQKVFAAEEAVDQLRVAISIFGGHGAIEDFTSIPRLYRDAMVNELWEGPRNVLLAQVYRDLYKRKDTFTPSVFVQELLPNIDAQEKQAFISRLSQLLGSQLYGPPTDENIKAAEEWELLMRELFRTYQEQILKQYPEKSLLPEQILDKVNVR